VTLGPVDFALKSRKMILGRLVRRALDCAGPRDESQTHRSQLRPAAMAPAGLALDHRLAEQAVDLLDELPSAAIRHSHGTAGSRDRSAGGNVFQKLDLARSDATFPVEVDAQGQGRHDEPYPVPSVAAG
jgi:hypothetical protein